MTIIIITVVCLCCAAVLRHDHPSRMITLLLLRYQFPGIFVSNTNFWVDFEFTPFGAPTAPPTPPPVSLLPTYIIWTIILNQSAFCMFDFS